MKVFSAIINYISFICIMLHDSSSWKISGKGVLKALVTEEKAIVQRKRLVGCVSHASRWRSWEQTVTTSVARVFHLSGSRHLVFLSEVRKFVAG